MIDKNRVRTMEARTDNNDKFIFSRARPNDAVSIKQMRIRFFFKSRSESKIKWFCLPTTENEGEISKLEFFFLPQPQPHPNEKQNKKVEHFSVFLS